MLEKLIIKNIALIDYAEINFTKGLNVLSGETGAGKSVIIEALNFVLGAKADKSLIRSGESECFASAEFSIDINSFANILSEFDIEADDILIISRKFNVDGKSSVKVNGTTVTVSMLKKLSSKIVDIHGQSEHFELLSIQNQLCLIDKICKDSCYSVKSELAEVYSQYKNTINEIDSIGGNENQRLIRLLNQEKISNAINNSFSALSEEGGALDILANINRFLSSISTLSNEFEQINERVSSAYSELDDISSTLSSILDEVDLSSYNIDEIEDRLDLIKTIKKKYGDTIEEVNVFLSNAINERDMLENFNETYGALLQRKKDLESNLYNLYQKLSNTRKEASKIFAQNVLQELLELGMPKAQFKINFNDFPSLQNCTFDSSNGVDIVEFMFSANNGEPCKPMGQIISGGEMSRFMLAIKSQASKFNEIQTFIFDEIDAGISGNIAKIVAKKFAKISLNKQLIAITHLPQISSMGDNNLLIEKIEENNKTFTKVKQLSKEEKVTEIIRLVGGDVSSQSATDLALDLIQVADKYKKEIS